MNLPVLNRVPHAAFVPSNPKLKCKGGFKDPVLCREGSDSLMNIIADRTAPPSVQSLIHQGSRIELFKLKRASNVARRLAAIFEAIV